MKHKDDITKNALAEPASAYDVSATNLFATTIGNAAREFNITGSSYDILNATRQGLPKRGLMALAKKISLTIQEFANILHISERTLQRYDNDEIIKTEYAEKAVELARLYTRGEEVFGSLDKFKTWMKSPVHVFRGDTPVSLLDTSIGFDMVFKELGRIEHGIFA
ncbi:antitoxin Xre/MbcA/ParS toxin-binding domain-containing protein [Mucilaginibacter sp. UR6-11]|uniref:type II RES/Xre toxin-antitoxin system antitoxin n=1 Tax=Mucilaginibacter sp. UR6-11 TaxID=1435644 RepID=UPI001E6338E8|nr:antitoxin Xre/MbcA/ParS toxin-binding domain-containing protein [Mucilaginibacter sp. UR6-11]MCC8423795.1 MbcA/ParS/Xre antitoxin family protein [Mucilaginibacter sp. UR6-11]